MEAPLTEPGQHASAQGGWIEHRPDGGTSCAFGTPFAFFSRGGDHAANLLIYFQGGGACWDWVSCSGLFDTSVEPGELHEYGGIFDAGRADNPLSGYAMVFIPYCTGDVHVGDTTQTYGGSGRVPVAHRGYRNVSAIVRWLGEQQLTPARVVIAGTSAGAYGALFHAPVIARIFPQASIIVVEDSGVPLLPDYPRILRHWGAVAGLERSWRGHAARTGPTLERAHREVAAEANVRRIAHLTSQNDRIQSAFYLVSGSSAWRDDAFALLARLGEALPSFRSFVLDGADHGLLVSDRFYTYASGGVALRDWFDELVRGADVASVRCAQCPGDER